MFFTPVKPMLLTMGKEAFDDDNFIYEPKWDGWRILLHKQGSRIEAYSRNGKRLTDKFPELQEAAESIRTDDAILDCEGVVLRRGRSVFDDFSYRGRLSDPKQIQQATTTHPATFVAFDVLATDTEHFNEPLIDRKKRLEEIIVPSSMLLPTMYVQDEGVPLKQLSVEKDLEGIVAKRKDSRYLLDTRSNDWIKIKNFKMIDTVILGYRMEPTFALIVGLQFKTVRNKPVATVEYGFKPDEKRAFLQVVKGIHTVKEKGIQWVEPRLCCKIQYLERTDNHVLRTVSFKGFVFDKSADDCRWAC